MKIGDIVYLAEPKVWYKYPNNYNEECTYPAGTPVKIIGDSGYRGWDVEFVETGVKMLECAFVKFVEIPPVAKESPAKKSWFRSVLS